MRTSNPQELIELLSGKSLIHRTGIWLMPIPLLGKELDQAARLNIDAVDIREKLLETLPANTRFLGLRSEKLLQLLNQLSDQYKGTDCILVCNFDLLLAKLKQQDRQIFWKQLYNTFPHRKHALIIAMPEGSEQLLPIYSELILWNKDRRLASTNVLEI